MKKIKEFIEKHSLEYDWRGYRRDTFMIWIPFCLINEFLTETDILKYTEYGHLENCGLLENMIAVDLTEAFYVEDIKDCFPQQN